MYFDEEKLKAYFANAPADASLDLLDLERRPAHISIIMDGNGRWATSRGLDRSKGHLAGVDSLRETVTTCVRLGIDVLSVYAFSTENWSRSKKEVSLLMQLFARTLLNELPLFEQENVQLRFLGDLEALPEGTRKVFFEGLQKTKNNTGMIFALAVNYGSRAELVRATQRIAQKVQAGELLPHQITQSTLADELYTAGLPDPDLLIRTSGELRLSNYLLWQLAYTELYVTPVLWPDFSRYDLVRALIAYQGRKRRFGGVDDAS